MANERARTLRKSMSDAERKLWRALRTRQLDGARFRRQHPIGRYVADFVCLERRLVVEVDGGQHTEDDQIARDARRDRWLVSEGYRVLRVPTIEVKANIAGVLDTSWAHCRKCRRFAEGATPTRNAIGLSRPTTRAERRDTSGSEGTPTRCVQRVGPAVAIAGRAARAGPSRGRIALPPRTCRSSMLRAQGGEPWRGASAVKCIVGK